MVGVDSVNLAIVHEHNNNLEYLANKDNPNWGLNEIE